MEILYLSALSSIETVNRIYKETGKNPGFAAQNFNRLIVKGFLQNGVDVRVLSTLPIPISSFKGRVYGNKTDIEENVVYKYIPFINLPILKQFCQFVYVFFYVFFWGLGNTNNKTIVCDALKNSLCIAALLASDINRVRRVGIITDILGLTVAWPARKLKYQLIAAINRWYITSFHYYVLLSEAMNELVNTKHRPYIIMEGLVSALQSEVQFSHEESIQKIILYAGGLHARYGIQSLVEAVQLLEYDNVYLDLYGSGPMSEELTRLSSGGSRIRYYGVVPNEDVIKAEYSATLLVNPRPTTEEFTKYSFPSKNMEYMVSGTPLLTTKLPSMPDEYYPFVFLIEDESVKGYKEALEAVLSLSKEDLKEKGEAGRRFVLEMKNNTVQTKRILKMIQE